MDFEKYKLIRDAVWEKATLPADNNFDDGQCFTWYFRKNNGEGSNPGSFIRSGKPLIKRTLT
jgi:hypothetical protein